MRRPSRQPWGATLSDRRLKDGGRGIVIDNVAKDSAAAQVGLRKGDVIIGVNRKHVKSVTEMRKLMESRWPVVALHVIRDNESMYFLLR